MAEEFDVSVRLSLTPRPSAHIVRETDAFLLMLLLAAGAFL
jgi:hypothetical protein